MKQDRLKAAKGKNVGARVQAISDFWEYKHTTPVPVYEHIAGVTNAHKNSDLDTGKPYVITLSAELQE